LWLNQLNRNIKIRKFCF